MLETKPKPSFDIRSITIKASIELSGKEVKKNHFHNSQSLLSGWSLKNS